MAGRHERPELLDMLDGQGLQQAGYFVWRPAAGQFHCVACDKPYQSPDHLTSRSHTNHVWWWLEAQHPGWDEHQVERVYETRQRNRNCHLGLWSGANGTAKAPGPAKAPPPQAAWPPQQATAAAPGAKATAAAKATAGSPPASSGAVRLDFLEREHILAAFNEMRDEVRKMHETQAKATHAALEAVTGDVKSIKEDMKSIFDKIEAVTGDARSLKKELHSIFEKLEGGLQTSDVETFKGDVETIKGNVETVKGDMGQMIVKQQVAGQSVAQALETIQEDVETIKNKTATCDTVKGDVETIMVDAGKRHHMKTDVDQSVAQAVESVQNEVMTIKGDVETIKQAVETIKESLKAPSRSSKPVPASPNGIRRTGSLSALQLPELNPTHS